MWMDPDHTCQERDFKNLSLTHVMYANGVELVTVRFHVVISFLTNERKTVSRSLWKKKERKKTDSPREGWEDTPPPLIL